LLLFFGAWLARRVATLVSSSRIKLSLPVFRLWPVCLGVFVVLLNLYYVMFLYGWMYDFKPYLCMAYRWMRWFPVAASVDIQLYGFPLYSDKGMLVTSSCWKCILWCMGWSYQTMPICWCMSYRKGSYGVPSWLSLLNDLFIALL
jgi:hypothetical protein